MDDVGGAPERAWIDLLGDEVGPCGRPRSPLGRSRLSRGGSQTSVARPTREGSGEGPRGGALRPSDRLLPSRPDGCELAITLNRNLGGPV